MKLTICLALLVGACVASGGEPAIPENLGDAAAYAVEDVPLKPAPGVDLESSYTHSGMAQYVEKLDCVVFMATRKPAKAFFVK